MNQTHDFKIMDDNTIIGSFFIEQVSDGLIVTKYMFNIKEPSVLYLNPPDNWLTLLHKWCMPVGSFEYVLDKICPDNMMVLEYHPQRFVFRY